MTQPPGWRTPGKPWYKKELRGASAGVRGSFFGRPGVTASGLHYFYHLHEKYESEHAMADAVVNEDDCPESDLNEMTVEWEKENREKSAGGWVNSHEQRRVNSGER